MGFFSRGKPIPLTGLRKDSDTPIGAIYSLFCPDADCESRLAAGELMDAERVLVAGDIINVRPATGGARRFALRVTGRQDDVVHCTRVDR